MEYLRITFNALALLLFSCGKKPANENTPEASTENIKSNLNYPGRYMGWEDSFMGTGLGGCTCAQIESYMEVAVS